MGAVYSSAKRFVMNYNYSNRAMRELTRQEKNIKPPPRHQSAGALREEERAREKDVEKSFKKDQSKSEHLLDMLKQVKVDSTGVNPDHPHLEELTTSRPLPQAKSQTLYSDLWFPEPAIVNEGKYTLRQALDFISKYQAAPDNYPAAVIAKEYKLDEKHVKNILAHFSNFTEHKRDEEKKTSIEEPQS